MANCCCIIWQGTSQSLPWLADLVEANDSSLDVLPVQCLCEFLIHDAMPDTTTNNTADDDDILLHVDKPKKQVRIAVASAKICFICLSLTFRNTVIFFTQLILKSRYFNSAKADTHLHCYKVCV